MFFADVADPFVPDHPSLIVADKCQRIDLLATFAGAYATGHTSPSLRRRTFPLPVAPTRANVYGRPPAVAAGTEDSVHDPARDRLDHHPR